MKFCNCHETDLAQAADNGTITDSPIVIGCQPCPESNIVSLNEQAGDLVYRRCLIRARRTIGIDDPQMAA